MYCAQQLLTARERESRHDCKQERCMGAKEIREGRGREEKGSEGK